MAKGKAKPQGKEVRGQRNTRASKRDDKKLGPAKSPGNRSTANDGRDIENPV
jgi:hypothetical protein